MSAKRSPAFRPWTAAFLIAVAWLVSGHGLGSGLVFFQPVDGQSTYGPSQKWPAAGVNSEVADDFDVVGSIDRVVASGFIWGVTPQWQGAYVRFYQFNPDGTPGSLQREYFLATGDPNLVVDE